MKKVIVYSLLFVYAFVQLKPLSAVLEDVMAHTFFAVQHMATVHYENGRYHLHKELGSINEQERSMQKNAASQKTAENTSPQQVSQWQIDVLLPSKPVSFYSKPLCGLPVGFSSAIFHPPLVA